MKVLVLGGVGAVGAVLCKEILETTDAEIVIGDSNFDAAKKYALKLGKKATAELVEAENKTELASYIKGKKFDLVANCTNIRTHYSIIESAIEGGANYIDLTGTFHEQKLELSEKAKKAGITAILAIGASPGITNVVARHGANGLDRVDEILIGFVAYRPMSLSPGLLATFLHQFFQEDKGRCYYKDGKFIPVPPFTGERTIYLPEPFGAQKVCYMAHAETLMLARSFKGVKLVETVGTWPPNLMEAAKTLYKYNFFSTEPIQIKGVSVTPREFLMQHLLLNEPKYEEKIFGMVAYVEVVGIRDGKRIKKTYAVTHPKEWKFEAIPTMTGINAGVAAAMLLKKEIKTKGVFTPENGIEQPSDFIRSIVKRGLTVSEKTERDFSI